MCYSYFMSLTEDINPIAKGIDRMSTGRILRLMNREDATVASKVKEAIPMIEKAVYEALSVLEGGGRIFYIGAGTSGRIASLDASEMPPTFGVPENLFSAIIAGGNRALRRSIEGAEDDIENGRLRARALTPEDFALGITAGGRTPFVLSFLKEAKGRGARCWLLTCSKVKKQPYVDGVISILTGPEVVGGSTRLKAGTATKLALNMFSTALMIRFGKVYDGLMTDVKPTNKKLIKRAESIIMKITGCTQSEAKRYLRLGGMNTKTASVMSAKGVSRKEAEGMLVDKTLREILKGKA
jgi:N-acetylmuramic acid 6-phosphate etherase